MKTTQDLLNAAVNKHGSERGLSLHLGLSASALSVARTRGRLSPGIAFLVAQYLGLNATKWLMAGVIEAERIPTVRRRLSAIAAQMTNSSSWLQRFLRLAKSESRSHRGLVHPHALGNLALRQAFTV